MRTFRVYVAVVVLFLAFSASLAGAAEPNPATLVGLRGLSAARAPDGTAMAVWVVYNGHDTELFYSRWDGRAWSAPEPVHLNPAAWDEFPSLTFDRDGNAVVAWEAGELDQRTLFTSRWDGRRWSGPAAVPPSEGSRPRQPSLVATPGGDLWLAWVGFDGNDDEILVSRWNGSTWSTAEQIGHDDTDPRAYDTQPRLAVGGDGSVWLAWTGYEKLLDDEVFVSRWDGRQWTAEQQISDSEDTVNSDPSLAVASDGTVWLAWNGRVPEAPDMGRRIHVASWSGEAGWSQETVVSSALDSDVTEERPCLALDASDQPHVLWHVDDGGQGLAYAALFGRAWSSARWAVQERVASGICLQGSDAKEFFWWPAGVRELRPLERGTMDSTATPLPSFGPPAQPDGTRAIVVNRHVAFGDSITWGMYTDPATGQPVGDYPSRLETMLDTRVVESRVFNEGVPGERTPAGMHRLKDDVLPTYKPQFVEIMEGTNDITNARPPDAIAENLLWMIVDTKRFGSRPLLSTVTPRLDSFNNDVTTLNSHIASVAALKNVHLVDNWQAFISYGDWPSLIMDHLHPNAQGMVVLTNSWYNGILTSAWWLNEETEPPTTWVENLPAESECGQIPVSWNGIDNMSWVVDYDVQVHRGSWANWLLGIPATSGIYSGGSTGETISFRVRGRDVVGNLSAYGAAKSTTLVDNRPPYSAEVAALPPAQQAPFEVRWSGADVCDSQLRYDVKYCVGSACTGPSGTWIPWLTSTLSTSGSFSPGSPAYGESYYFRVRAYDSKGLWKDSAPVSTRLARYTVRGDVVNVRHEGIYDPVVSSPDALWVEPSGHSGYIAYIAGAGAVDLTASHDQFGTLPPMQGLPVTTDLTGIDLVLPPQDDAVQNGGFEGGTWGNWAPGGSQPPLLSGEPHTGDGSALLGAAGKESTLSQSIAVPSGLTNPTLSFLVRLDDAGGASSALQVQLAGTSISHTEGVSSGEWVHVWLPVEAAVGKNVSLMFTVSNKPAVRLDEVSLGSAQRGVRPIFLPIIRR